MLGTLSRVKSFLLSETLRMRSSADRIQEIILLYSPRVNISNFSLTPKNQDESIARSDPESEEMESVAPSGPCSFCISVRH